MGLGRPHRNSHCDSYPPTRPHLHCQPAHSPCIPTLHPSLCMPTFSVTLTLPPHTAPSPSQSPSSSTTHSHTLAYTLTLLPLTTPRSHSHTLALTLTLLPHTHAPLSISQALGLGSSSRQQATISLAPTLTVTPTLMRALTLTLIPTVILTLTLRLTVGGNRSHDTH